MFGLTRSKAAQQVRYVVEGRWPFPIDMLRRDAARPATPDDNMVISGLRGSATLGPCRVTLISDDVSAAPNTARWESFGWRVVECPDPTRLSAPVVLSQEARARKRGAAGGLLAQAHELVRDARGTAGDTLAADEAQALDEALARLATLKRELRG